MIVHRWLESIKKNIYFSLCRGKQIRGKILSVIDSVHISCKGYKIYENDDSFWIIDGIYSLLASYSVLRRISRSEITGLYFFENGDQICVAKKGLFLRKKGSSKYVKCFSMSRGSKPLNLCITPSGNAYFGEYFQNTGKQPVNIYCSEDNAQTWHNVYTFNAGTINHIHGLFYDKYTQRIWVVTGDRDNECIIGYTEDEFKNFIEVFKGGQDFRTCQLFFYSDFVVFATDSQYMQNEIKCFDRKTLKITTLAKIQGSAIKGGQSGDISFLSTTVEPSSVNKDKSAHIWVTKDGLHWKEVFSAEKDSWPFLFQFGTFEFPQYMSPIQDTLWFNGRALKGYDGKIGSVKI